MEIKDILVTVVLIFIFKYLITKWRKSSKFPPGPPSIPVFGSIPFMPGRGIEKFVSDYVASFGPVTGAYAGSYPSVMINDWKLAKSLFSKEEFAGRLR